MALKATLWSDVFHFIYRNVFHPSLLRLRNLGCTVDIEVNKYGSSYFCVKVPLVSFGVDCKLFTMCVYMYCISDRRVQSAWWDSLQDRSPTLRPPLSCLLGVFSSLLSRKCIYCSYDRLCIHSRVRGRFIVLWLLLFLCGWCVYTCMCMYTLLPRMCINWDWGITVCLKHTHTHTHTHTHAVYVTYFSTMKTRTFY